MIKKVKIYAANCPYATITLVVFSSERTIYFKTSKRKSSFCSIKVMFVDCEYMFEACELMFAVYEHKFVACVHKLQRREK